MKKLYLFRKPIVLSISISLVLSLVYAAVAFYMLELVYSAALFWMPIAGIWTLCLIFNILHLYRSKKALKQDDIETEEKSLIKSLSALLLNAKRKPIYLMLGNKGAGKEALLNSSSAIKPIDRKRTVKTDFYTWFESDNTVYIKPNARLIFQENSTIDEVLWKAFIDQLIALNPRRPLAGCLFCFDLEYLITHEEEQIEYTLDILRQRLENITQATTSSLPLYIFITKLDKLLGFKEYMNVSPLKGQVEHLSISLRDAKGAMADTFARQYAEITSKLESNILECTYKERDNRDNKDKQAIIGLPKQFELCQNEIEKILHSINQANSGAYYIDIRGLYFISNLQGGRRYNLLAKSCSNFFNVPIIASEYSQLHETPFFTRLIIESHILPEAGYAGENRSYLRMITKRSRLTLTACVLLVTASGYLLTSSFVQNLNVINALADIEEVEAGDMTRADINTRFVTAISEIRPYYDAWALATNAFENQIISVGVSRLDDAVKIAHDSLIMSIEHKLIPLVEQSLSREITKNDLEYKELLSALKAYLMLSEVDKRKTPFLLKEIKRNFTENIRNQDLVAKSIDYLNVYLNTNFSPVKINFDLVRSTRRHLLATSKVNMVYAKILNDADNAELGQLNLKRAIGFQFSTVFDNRIDDNNLSINKLYTATGYSTFYRPRSEMLATSIISDNWVLGLSNNQVPSDEELEAFREKVRKKYTDDYITFWRNAIYELRFRDFNDIVELSNTIDILSGPASPLTTVLNILYTNTKLSPDADYLEELAKKKSLLDASIEVAKDKVEKIATPDYVLMSRVEQAFSLINQLKENPTKESTSPWEQIIMALSDVRSYLKNITDSPNIQIAALEAAKSRIRATDTDPLIRLKQIAQKAPEPVKSWLLNIVNQTWKVLLLEARKGIQQQWQSEIWTEFDFIGAGRYPFNRVSEEEISIANFEKFFATAGTLDNFIKNNLSPFYDTNLWQPKELDGEYLELSQELLVQLKNYNVIKNTLFDYSSNLFSVPFTAKVVDLDSSAIQATINLADKTMKYYHGPAKAKEFAWPPADGDLIVSLIIQDIGSEGRQHTRTNKGQWALFRLLGDSELTPTIDGGFIADTTVSGRGIKIEFKPSAPINPFKLKELFNFSVPKVIYDKKVQ